MALQPSWSPFPRVLVLALAICLGCPPAIAQEEAPEPAEAGAEEAAPAGQDGFSDLAGLAGGEDFAFDTPEAIRDYALSVGDQFAINLWSPELRLEKLYSVPFEGRIFLPQVGEIAVNGLTTGQVRQKLEKALRPRHPGLNVSVLLVRTRAIRVFVTGLVKAPGVVQVPALSRLSVAIARAGGILPEGSRRQISLLRAGAKTPITVDYYRFQLKGDTAGNPLLKAGDILNVPEITRRAYIKGEVWRPGFFEFLEGEKVRDLLAIAHGTKPSAALPEATLVNLKTFKREERVERKLDLTAASALERKLADLDQILIPAHTIAYIERPRTRVTVAGAVKKGGTFLLTIGTRLRDALSLVGAIKPGAGLREVKIYHNVASGEARFDEPLTVDAYKLMFERDESQNIELQDGDLVLIPDSKNLAEDSVVYVFGDVGSPGKVPFRAGDRVSDYLNKAGGTLQKANLRGVTITRAGARDVIRVDAHRILREGNLEEDQTLRPGDIVNVPEEFFYIANIRDVINIILATVALGSAVAGFSTLAQQPQATASSVPIR